MKKSFFFIAMLSLLAGAFFISCEKEGIKYVGGVVEFVNNSDDSFKIECEENAFESFIQAGNSTTKRSFKNGTYVIKATQVSGIVNGIPTRRTFTAQVNSDILTFKYPY